MVTSLVLLLFGTLAVVGIFSMAKIQRAEYFEARAAKLAKDARIKEFRAKCYRPDGD